MADHYEFMMLLLGAVTLMLILAQRRRLSRTPSWRWLLLAFLLVQAAWVFTIAEHYVAARTLNFLEHATNAAGAIVLAFWCWRRPGLQRVRHR